MKHNFEKFCKDYENIENYEKALKDNFKGWNCHHRLETHNSDGERRLVDITVKELKALGMYYDRPADELIFLSKSEHSSFNKGKPKTEDVKNKISETLKGKLAGEKNPMYGKHHSEATREKISKAEKGKYVSEETRRKLSEASKGNKNMLGKKHSEETKKKIGEKSKGRYPSAETRKKLSAAKKGNTNTKGKHWYNNGEVSKMAYECPEGFVPGMLK